jgi:hypothetical protein
MHQEYRAVGQQGIQSAWREGLAAAAQDASLKQ